MSARVALCMICAHAVVAKSASAGDMRTFASPGGHYRVSTDLDPAAARTVATHMDRIFAEYDRRLSAFHTRDSRPMPLYVFEKQKDYERFLKSRGIDGANTSGMFFVRDNESGLATFSAAQNRARMNRVLQHEGFHQFAYIRVGSELPVWANEGLAEYFAEALYAKGKWMVGLAPEGRLRGIQKAIRESKAYSLQDLILMPHEDWNGRVNAGDPRAGLMYDQAWALVHFLVNADGGRYADAFVAYMQRISKGDRPADAFAKAFGKDSFGDMQKAWEKYTLSLEPDSLTTAIRRLVFLGAGMRKLAAKGIGVEALDDLKRELRKIDFRLRIFEHANLTEIAAKDDAPFEAPESGNPRKPSAIKMVAGKDKAAPPEITISGLKVGLRLVWIKDADGGFVDDVAFE